MTGLPAILKPTANQIRAYRTKHGCGLVEAKKACMGQWRFEVLRVLQLQCDVIGDTRTALSGVIAYLLEDDL